MNITPGPWICTSTSYHYYDYRLDRPNGQIEEFDIEEARTNAKAIAAVPEMIDALETLLATLEFNRKVYGSSAPTDLSLVKVEQVARRALAKAKGEIHEEVA